jgi:hypothetical protein
MTSPQPLSSTPNLPVHGKRGCIPLMHVDAPLDEREMRQAEEIAPAWSITVSFTSSVAICAYDSGSALGSFWNCHRRKPTIGGAQQC